MTTENIMEKITERLKYYYWFVCLGEGTDNKILVYVKNDGLFEKEKIENIIRDYTKNFEIIKLATYSPGDRNV